MRRIVLTAPDATAASGISTHVNQLMHSNLQEAFRLGRFRCGGQGLSESRVQRLYRRALTPLAWVKRLRDDEWPIVHINTALDRKALARDALLLMLARVMGCPVIWQVHGGMAPSAYCRRDATAGMLRSFLRLADRVVVISRADEVEYRPFVASERLVRIVNAVDTMEYDSIERRTHTNGPLTVAYLGRLIAAKGVLDVVDAMVAVRSEGVPVLLKIAGTGLAAVEVLQRIRHHGLQEHVQLLGPLTEAPKLRLLAESDLFALPTYHRERMPYALLEAMAAGVVPITCAAGDIDELVVPGQHGFIVEPRRPDLIARSILSVAGDRSCLAALSRACRARVQERYGIVRMETQFAELYRSLCRA
jgi:glycosyltransferase involved in cell wall biosynthesis